jgi:hypothetical protein
LRTLTLLEKVAVVSVGSSVLAVFVPAFARNLHASHFVEPIDGLQDIAGRAQLIAASRPVAEAYPDSVGLTPETVPAGEPSLDPTGTWDHPTWRQLGYAPDGPHSYSFEFVSRNSAKGSTFTATAHGDLDGDGIFSTFSITGHASPEGELEIDPIFMEREVE